MEAVRIENMSFSYPTGENKALEDISLSLPEGSFNLLIGASGSGKTTLLKLLKGEIAPNGNRTGSISVCGQPLEKISFDRVGFVPQAPDDGIVTDKVWHEMAFGLENMGLDPGIIRLRVGETASYFGIAGWYHRNTDTLSGGQKQLLNLASVMVMRPDVLLLDEPTSQLDPIAAAGFLSTLKKINRESGVTVIISEHRLEDVFPIADSVIVLDNGSISACGDPREVCLSLKEAPLFSGFPTASRLWARLGCQGECPLTVSEGRSFLEKEFSKARGSSDYTVTSVTENAIQFKDVCFRYERKSPDVIKEMTFGVGQGEIFSILGENGSGKSTVLRLISGIEKPYAGTVRILGKSIKEYKGNSLYKDTVALLPQDPTVLFVENTVIDDLKSAWKLSGGREADFSEAGQKWIDLFGIDPLLSRHPYDLSGGEQQKCALVKLLLRKPKILLLDEPTKGLDASLKRTLKGIINTLKNEDITLIMVTHDIEFAAQVSDRCGLLFDGKILSTGHPNIFFAENSYYTTAAARISRGRFQNTVLCDEIIKLCEESSRA